MSGLRFAFGPFVLNPDAGTLSREGTPLLVGYRALLLLKTFLNRPGEVLTKSDLIDAAWQGAAVEESNLSVQIASLRKLLGQSPDGRDWITTIPRVGYRFVGTVNRPADGLDGKAGVSLATESGNGPSIAVLPFVNLSDDRKQEYFTDGIVEEIITALSRMRWLFVVARNSSFTYKGRAVDVKQIGRELGVRYVLEGSVRKARSRVRITGQLIDAATGTHLWADHFEGDLGDVFDLQDQVAASVVGAIAPKLERAEVERAKRKPTESLDAYDYYLRGWASAHQLTRETNDEALRLFSTAIELDPEFAPAHGMAAWCFVMRKANGWMVDRAREIAQTERLALKAVDLGKDDAVALSRGGHALAFVLGDLEGGAAFIDRSLELNPNLAAAWLFSGWVRANLGDTETALQHLMRAISLSPFDPMMFGIQNGIAMAHLFAGRYQEAASWAEKSLREKPDYLPSLRFAAASHALAGRLEEAKKTMVRIRRLDPDLRISNLAEIVPLRRSVDMALLVEGLRKAGLPE